MIFHFSIVQVHFVFCLLFPYLGKYYDILLLYFGSDVIRRQDIFFRACFASFYTHTSHLTFFVCFFILFRLAVLMRECLRKHFLYEFPISYSHTEWYLLFSRGETALASAEASPLKI